MLKEWMIFTCSLLTLAGASLPSVAVFPEARSLYPKGRHLGQGSCANREQQKSRHERPQCATTGLWSAAGDISH